MASDNQSVSYYELAMLMSGGIVGGLVGVVIAVMTQPGPVGALLLGGGCTLFGGIVALCIYFNSVKS